MVDVEKENGDKDFCNAMLLKFKKMKEKVHAEIKNEVDRCLLEPSEDPCDTKFDILEWLKVNPSKYQNLSHFARDVFAILVSTVSSESTFSTGGRILDPFPSSLHPKTVEALICSQNWL